MGRLSRRWTLATLGLIAVATLAAACGGSSGCAYRDIQSPADFDGCTVGVKGVVQSEFLAMLAANGLTQADLELVDVGFNPVVLAEGTVDVYPVFLSNEPDSLERIIGVPVRVFQASDFGVPTLGVTYVVSEEFLEDEGNREALRRFLLATMRGFQFALADPPAAIVAAQAFIPAAADLTHERFILDTELDNAVSGLTAANGLGWFTPDQFQALQVMLLQYAGIAGAVALDAALDRSFLDGIYQDGVLQFPWPERTPPEERLSLTFMAGFRAQSNLPFVAAYVAQEYGFFEALGLDVTIRHSSGGGEHIQLLLAGDVAVSTQPASEVLQRRADPGAPLVVVALFGQTGDLGYAVLANR